MQYNTYLLLPIKRSVLALIATVAIIISGCVTVNENSSHSTSPLSVQSEQQTRENITATTLKHPERCSSPRAQVSEIVIGALLPLTESPAVQAGEAMQAAIDIAIDDINAAGGVLAHPVRVITYDTKGSPKTGIEMTEKLIMQDCAIAIIGVYHSHVGLVVKETAHKYGIPIIFSEPYNDAITSDFYPEVFRVAPTTRLTTQTYIDWIYTIGDHNDDEEQTIVIVADNSTFEASNASLIAQQLEVDEKAVVETLLIDLPADDFSSMIARIIALENSPDTILIWFNGDPGYAFHKQLNEAGIGPQNKTLVVLRHSTINSDLFWQRVPQGLHTVITKVGPWHSTVSDMGKEFAASYSERAERWPESYAFQAYDSARLIASAIDQSGSLEAKAIIDTLESIDIMLASGRYHFPYGSKNKPDTEEVPAFMWHQWPDPHILFLQFDDVEQNGADMSVLWPELYRTIDFSALYLPAD